MRKNVKNTTFPSIFDLLMPHTCRGCGRLGSALCNRCKKYILANHTNICPICKNPVERGNCGNCKDLPPVFVAGKRDELIGKLAQDYKYHSVRALALPLAEILNEILPQSEDETRIVPLPTISYHVRQRGLDHTYLIAKRLCQLRGPDYKLDPILKRANSTVQVGADKATRKAQASKAYQLSHQAHISKTATYLLLDDVWTTGASLTSAVALLKNNGIDQIIIAVLALSE